MVRKFIVLQVLPSLNSGGTEQSAVDLAIYLKSQKITNFVASNGGKKAILLKKNQINHITLPLHRKAPWAIWQNSRELIKIIDKYSIDILHARSRAPAWAAWLAHKARPNTHFITTFHGTYGTSNWFKRAYNRVMLKGPWVIANSLFIKRHIIETYTYPAGRILVAQRGANPEVFNPAKVQKNRSKLLKSLKIDPSNGPILTLVGRLTRWKGQGVFIEALNQIKPLKWQALIVGGPLDSTYAAELQAAAALAGLIDRIRFLGDRSDVAQLYDMSDIILSCSIEPEAFGRVAVEGQMMGKPVIATALGGSLETIIYQDFNKKTGWLVEPNSPQALARCLSNALTHRHLWGPMGRRARAWALARFTTEACCAAELKAYKKLIETKR